MRSRRYLHEIPFHSSSLHFLSWFKLRRRHGYEIYRKTLPIPSHPTLGVKLFDDRKISSPENSTQDTFYASQSAGLFDDSVNQINEKIDFMGNRISTLSSDLESRLHALEGLIEVVQNGRKTANKSSRQTRSMKHKESAPSPQSPTPTTIVTRKRGLPIQSLNKTLREG